MSEPLVHPSDRSRVDEDVIKELFHVRSIHEVSTLTLMRGICALNKRANFMLEKAYIQNPGCIEVISDEHEYALFLKRLQAHKRGIALRKSSFGLKLRWVAFQFQKLLPALLALLLPSRNLGVSLAVIPLATLAKDLGVVYARSVLHKFVSPLIVHPTPLDLPKGMTYLFNKEVEKERIANGCI